MLNKLFDWFIGRFGINGVACLTGLIVLITGIWIGATVTDWRLSAQISDLKSVLSKERADRAEAAAFAVQAARGEEQRIVDGFFVVDLNFNQGKEDAKRKESAVVAGLRNDAIKLRQQWRGCETSRLSEAAARAGGLDDTADLRATSAGRVVRAAAECDARIIGLQEILRKERE